MPDLTVEEREELGETLASIVVPWLTYGVHHGDEQLVAEQLLPLDRQELMALAVVLASRCRYPLMRPDDGIVDDVAVERASTGEPMPLTSAERFAAARLLASRGIGPVEAGRRLGVDRTSVRDLYKRAQAGAA